MMMSSETTGTHINTTAIIRPEGFILSNSSLKEMENVCDETDYVMRPIKFYFKDDDLVELEEVDDENCNVMNDDECADDDGEEEKDLTNLTWLTELRNQTMSFVNMHPDEEHPSEDTVYEVGSQKEVQNIHVLPQKSSTNSLEHGGRKIINAQKQESHVCKTSNKPSKRPSPSERYEIFLHKIKRDFEIYQQSSLNFQSDITEKPPFNYSHIIGMAMLESGRHVTLQQICSWIEMKFAFFRVRKKWNNSIRHNLSLHPCFRKIGRNKEDKGKGGYWELGVDPKKCDRKRIRNRKSSSHIAKNQSKHMHSYFKASKRSQQQLSKNANFKYLSGYLKPYLNNLKERDYEEVYLDDINVQQNIEVTSSNFNNDITSTSTFCRQSETHSIPEHNLQKLIKMSTVRDEEQEFLTDIINDSIHMQDDENMNEFNNCQIATEPEQSSLAQSCHQEYKLGTIIISSSSMAELVDIPNRNPSTLNSFISTCSIKQLTETIEKTTQQQHNIIFTKDDILERDESVVIPSYMSNLPEEKYTKGKRDLKSSQCLPASTSSSSTISLEYSTSPVLQVQPRSNVIVEQLMQPSLTLSTVCMSTNATSSSTIALTAAPNGGYPNLLSENFRPYIDGIDEAFQYLRSIDKTRNGDILDNLLDISVSDY